MNFDEVLKHRAQLRKAMEGEQREERQQLCAKLAPSMHRRIDTVSAVLGMTKRDFIEVALGDALDRAEAAIAQARARRSLAMPPEAWQRGVDDGMKPGDHECPFQEGTADAWAWSSGYVEGRAKRA